MPRRRKAELVEAQDLSPSVRSLTFRTSDESPVGHLAGQYLDLVVPTPQGVPFRRPYSIASPPLVETPSIFEIAVTRVESGPTSNALHRLEPGARVEIEAPKGTFVCRPDDRARPLLFVAAGTGLAPIRAILAEQVRLVEGPPMVLLFGCRGPADRLWSNDFCEWQRACPRLSAHVSLSRPPPDWNGHVGHVQRHVASLARSLANPLVFICGLSAMVDDVVSVLTREVAVPRDALRYETYD